MRKRPNERARSGDHDSGIAFIERPSIWQHGQLARQGLSMRASRYDRQARRKTVSVPLSENLVSKAKAAGIDISRIAERALAKALDEVETARIRADLEEAARITDDYVGRHGHPFADWVEAFSPEPGADDAA